MGEAAMGCCCWICVGCPPIRFDCSLRRVVTRRRPMQYSDERRHSRLETFKLDNVYTGIPSSLASICVSSILGDSRGNSGCNQTVFHLLFYFGFWIWWWQLYLYFHFVWSSQASDYMSSLFSIFSPPKTDIIFNIQIKDGWPKYIWALWKGKKQVPDCCKL
jgi:hypothetical protein